MGVKAIYPGSFDPFTLGHLDVVKRAARMFDQLTVCVCVNSAKPAGLFVPEERADLVRASVEGLPNVDVDVCHGLIAEYAKARGASVLVKGLRAVSDYESEAQMAMLNAALCDGLDTVFLHARPKHTYMSSSVVRELARHGSRLAGFVPREIEDRVLERVRALSGHTGKG